jgi:tetratricopeptide (TPR) repeat protein
MTMDSDNDPESILDRVVQDFVDAQLQGRAPDIEEIVRAHPELERQIRQRIQSLHEVNDLFAGLVQDAGNPDTASFDPDLIGRRLGDFEILRLIGKGGMGAVFLARQVSLGREVALKVIADVGGSQSKSLERFRREATVLAQLSHPHIVPIHDIGQEGPYAYFAMEYVRGVSLDAILAAVRRAGPAQKASDILRKCFTQPVADDAPEQQGQPHAAAGAQIDRDYIVAISNIVVEVASALQCAHDRGILHRDVKPSNILIDSDARAKLVDFGLARAQSHPSLTAAGEFFGTPSYTSPEQIRSPESADGRADVYSLAATYYECLTLRRPFEGDTVNETLTNVLNRDIIPPRRHSPRLAPDLNTVLLHALEKQPQDRYQSAADFAADIQNVLEFKPITAKRPSLTRVAYRAVRRNRMTSTAIVVALIAVALCSVLISARGEQRRKAVAVELWDTGTREFDAGRYENALESFEEYLRIKPTDAEAYRKAGCCYYSLHRDREAVDAYTHALQIDPNLPDQYPLLAQAYDRLGQPEAAIIAYERAIRAEPNNLPLYRYLATSYEMMERHNKALETYRRLERIVPQSSRSLSDLAELGKAYYRLGRYNEAVAILTTVAEGLPDSGWAHRYLAWSYERLGDSARAAKAYEECAKALQRYACLRPSADSWSDLADTYFQIRQYGKSIETYRHVLEMSPNCLSAYLGLGKVYQRLRQPDESLKAYKQALQIDPNSVKAYLGLGRALSDRGAYHDANEAFMRAAKLDPRSDDPYVALGAMYFDRHLPEDAVQYLERAREINPDDVQTRSFLAMARSLWGQQLFSQGLYENSLVQFRLAADIDPNRAATYVALGTTYEMLGSSRDAIAADEHAIRLDPKCASAYLGLYRIYLAVKRFTESLLYLEKAIELDPKILPTKLLAQCYALLGRQFVIYPRSYEEASKACKRAIDLDPICAEAYVVLAFVYAHGDSPTEALKSLQRAIEIDPNTTTGENRCDAYEEIGLSFLRSGALPDALEVIQRAAAIAPNRARTQQVLGQAYAMLGSYEESLAHLRRAAAIDPNNILTYCALGHTYHLSRSYRDAIRAYEQAMKLDPNNSMPVAFLAELYMTCEDAAVRDVPKAISFAQKACELTKYQDEDDLFILAGAYAASGDFEKAVQYQEKAVQLAVGDKKKTDEELLAKYRTVEPKTRPAHE